MALGDFLRKGRERKGVKLGIPGSADELLEDAALDVAADGPIRVQTRKTLGFQATTFQWDASCDVVSLLVDLPRLRQHELISGGDLPKLKMEILGLPEPVSGLDDSFEGRLGVGDLWRLGKWVVGRSGATVSRTDDPVWQVEQLQKLRGEAFLTDPEFSYLEEKVLRPNQVSLWRRIRYLRGLWWDPPPRRLSGPDRK
jgi:hypothetical protein